MEELIHLACLKILFFLFHKLLRNLGAKTQLKSNMPIMKTSNWREEEIVDLSICGRRCKTQTNLPFGAQTRIEPSTKNRTIEQLI